MAIDRIDKPQCIICDVDGTVALMKGQRTPYEYDKADKDEPNIAVIDTVLAMKKYYKCALIMLSARENVAFNVNNDDNKSNHTYSNKKYKNAFDLTAEWLNEYVSKDWHTLIMRVAGDYRKDCYVKYDIGRMLMQEWEPIMVFDDRNQVVDMWRNGLGLQCFQVADGNF